MLIYKIQGYFNVDMMKSLHLSGVSERVSEFAIVSDSLFINMLCVFTG